MVIFSWNGCRGGSFEGCVCSRGGFPCIGEFDVVMCVGGFDRVGIHLNIMDFLYGVMECLWGLYVSCGV